MNQEPETTQLEFTKENKVVDNDIHLERANPSCNHCYGTGICGYEVHGYDKKDKKKKTIQKAPRSPIFCICIHQASIMKVWWLQRYDKNLQPWLNKEETTDGFIQ